MEKTNNILWADRVEKFVFAVALVSAGVSAFGYFSMGNIPAGVAFILVIVWMSLYWQANQHAGKLRSLLDDVLDEYGKAVELLKSIGEAINAAKDEPVQVNPEK